ncbi:MAG: methylornithine synthase PylB [Desulfobacterales bacterium]|nr:MAG: methylornithine synthase PylB [Desulfobacterales bacterium]
MKPGNPRYKLAAILEKADQQATLTREESAFLLNLKQNDQINAVFRAAGKLCRRYFGDRVFLYGFIYISTYCRNNCSFCYYRSTNTQPSRYRLGLSDIIRAARRLTDSGVHLIDLTLGEDPVCFLDDRGGFDGLIESVKAVRRATALPVMVSPGVVPDDVLAELAAAGADWYACYQETHNPLLFEKLRPGQSYAARLAKKHLARRLGMLIEEGVLCGAGESVEDIVESIEVMRCLRASQLRAMSLVPQQGTPMRELPASDSLRERMTIAVLRLAFPDKLIPASLDVAGLDGLQSRLAAGANVVTSLVPPGFGLAGVAQNSLDIAEARRTTAGIRPELEKLGLRTASAEDYHIWMADRRKKILRKPVKERLAC